MNASEIRKQYTTDSRGRITDPGKFEGEMIYVPYFWGLGLEGFADHDDGKVFRFRITPEDRAAFPELPKRRRVIRLIESDTGFVCEC